MHYLPTFETLSSPSARQSSQLTSRCQNSQGLGLVCARLCAWKEFLHVASHCPLPIFASFKRWQSVFLEESFVSPGPSHPCTRWPSTRFFHPVGSCTHLFSTSKTQGLRGVMIGFLLCNLLEFCLTSKMAFSYPSHAHTPSEVCTRCKQLSVWVCISSCSQKVSSANLNSEAERRSMSVFGNHLSFFCKAAYLCPSVIPLSIGCLLFISSHAISVLHLAAAFEHLSCVLAQPFATAWECVRGSRSHTGVCLWFFFSPPPPCFKDIVVVRTVPG